MTTNKSEKVPARVTWWRMFWMLLIGNAALTPYLKSWRGDSPYTVCYKTGLSAIILFPAIPPIISYGLNWPSVFGNGRGLQFTIWVIGASLLVAWMVIMVINLHTLFKTVSAFQMVWNAGTIELLSARDHLAIDVKKIVEPAVREARMVLACERLSGVVDQFSRLIPLGKTSIPLTESSRTIAEMTIWQREVAKKKMSRYFEACVGFNALLHHRHLTEVTFRLARAARVS